MSVKDKFLLKGLKKRLKPKDVALFKLVLWVLIIVWMIFFATHSVITAQILADWSPKVFPQGMWMQGLAKTLPVWYLFTVGLIIFLVLRWATKKLRPKRKSEENKERKGTNE